MTTIHDVARRAGVSSVTVSRVLNGASNVNAGTRARVEQAIKELGYLPNLAARSLRSRQTSTIALIVPDITNAFWTTVARGVEDAAQAEGYSVLLGNSDESLAKQTGYMNAVLQQRVDGVIIAPYDSDPRNLQPFNELKTPVVILDRRVDGWKGDTVRSDSVSGAFALTQHLLSLGHRKIAIVSGPPTTSTADDRVAGYCLALEAAGIPVDLRLIQRGEYRASSGRAMTEALFAAHLDPTAVVAANNALALGVLEALQHLSLKVPRDVALVAFDDLPDLARFFPFLTVVVQPAYDMGLNAAQLLLSRINADVPIAPRQVVLPSRLMLRYSCGRFLDHPDIPEANLTPFEGQSETRLIKPAPAELLQRLSQIPGLNFPGLDPVEGDVRAGQPDVERLRAALAFRAPDRLPYLEPRVASKAVLEAVLERSLPYTQAHLASGKQTPSPVEMVEFAARTGMDAVACEMNWLPEALDLAANGDTRLAFSHPSMTEHLNRLENCLRAAQGKQVGVYVSLSGILAGAVQLAGGLDHLAEVERWMDVLLSHQEKVLRAVCDRFSADLLFVLVRDSLEAAGSGPEAGAFQADAFYAGAFFQERVLPRLSRLIAPAREHGLLAGISLPSVDLGLIPALHGAGFGLLHALNWPVQELAEASRQWAGRMVLAGGLDTQWLSGAVPEQVEAHVRAACTVLPGSGGIVLSTSAGIGETARPENFAGMVRAIQRSGVYQLVRSTEKL